MLDKIGQKVFSNSGSYIGYVSSLCFNRDLKKISGFCIVDKEENKGILPLSYVEKMGDAIFIDDAFEISYMQDDEFFNPVGCDVYSSNGVFLGTISNFAFERYDIIKIITTLCEFKPSQIKIASSDCVIIGSRAKVKTKIFQKLKNDAKEIKVETMGKVFPIPVRVTLIPKI